MNIKTRTLIGTILTTSLLTACGSRGPAIAEPDEPEATATARNTVILPAITYGKTPAGLQLSKADDNCDIPTSLTNALQEQLEAPYEFAVPMPSEALAGAPTLRIEITDILANAGGLYGGPKIVRLHGVLERVDATPVHFDAQRHSFLYFGVPRSTCKMVSIATYGLGGDIANWLLAPVDGAQLGDLNSPVPASRK
ncbi:hypothetical protein [Hydrogenophaga laconesensis]|uniref:Lipoprotein n=1 Tax=Hydrogenophaga laconesensis TaxID=1805971 RepID=A0ABU1VIE3_9BURK|nr:hypothetical protein [Hydrogenophaga laconesensis]MDR7097262.1 hypothetical protein [Hydrogenophaga laconesensis]